MWNKRQRRRTASNRYEACAQLLHAKFIVEHGEPVFHAMNDIIKQVVEPACNLVLAHDNYFDGTESHDLACRRFVVYRMVAMAFNLKRITDLHECYVKTIKDFARQFFGTRIALIQEANSKARTP